MKEKEIQKAICKMLSKSPDVLWFSVNTSGKVMYRKYWITIGKIFSQYLESTDGYSDIVGMTTDAAGFLIEIKSETGKVSKEQQAVIDMVIEHGGKAGIARNTRDAEQIIRGFKIEL